MTDEQFRQCIADARRIASAVGPQHAWWDVISDAESILAGRPAIMSRDQVEAAFADMFGSVASACGAELTAKHGMFELKNGDWNCVRCGAEVGVAFISGREARDAIVNLPRSCTTAGRCRGEMILTALSMLEAQLEQ